MKIARHIAYVLFLAGVFLSLTAIKLLIPKSEPERPIDKIGMKLYRPLFFGLPAEKPENTSGFVFAESTDTIKAASAKEEVKEESKEIKRESPVAAKVEKKPMNSGNVILDSLITNYKETVLSQRRYRNDVVVRYYKHGPDGDKANVLVPYGFYLHVRPISNEAHYEAHYSNVLYYGKDFPERDVRFIAALLVDNGFPLKSIEPFRDFEGWKHSAVEIAGNPKLNDRPTLTVQQIVSYNLKH